MTPLYKVLGYLGALPFIGAAAALFIFDETLARLALGFLFMYAGLIASFLGGVHWAHSFIGHREGQMLLSMLPSLLSLVLSGWGIILLTSGMLAVTFGHVLLSVALGLYILLYAAILIMDAQWLDKEKLPAGYMTTRSFITLCVIASLVASIVFLWI